MSQYEVDPVAELAREILLRAIDPKESWTIPAGKAFDIAEEFHREGVKRGWIKMDPQPEVKRFPNLETKPKEKK